MTAVIEFDWKPRKERKYLTIKGISCWLFFETRNPLTLFRGKDKRSRFVGKKNTFHFIVIKTQVSRLRIGNKIHCFSGSS